MSKVVTKAKLHTGFFIPGIANGGNMRADLPPDNSIFKGMKMTLEDNGSITLEFDHGGYTHTHTIAAANIISCAHPPVPKKQADAQPLKESKK